MIKNDLSEKPICNLQILKESDIYFDDNQVKIRYKDLEEDCVVETTRKWHKTKLGRYVNIKGRRYYIDNKYRYNISIMGDDFDFSNLRVKYYNYEDAFLALTPINNLKIKDLKSLLYRNKQSLKKDIQYFDKEKLWEEDIDEIWYDIWQNEVKIPMIDWCNIIEVPVITEKDKNVFEILKDMYFEDNNIEDDGCRCIYRDGFIIHNENDWDEYYDWALSVGLE